MAKINYHIHTDAIKHNLIPVELTPPQSERLIKLNQIAIQQMCVLENIENRKLLKN